jgi:hypothetical protein
VDEEREFYKPKRFGKVIKGRVELYVLRKKLLQKNFLLSTQLLERIKTAAANSVFMKLWLEVKLSAFNHYFAFVVG